MDQHTSPEIAQISDKSKVKPLLLAIGAVVLIAAAIAGTYYWQHQKLAKATSDIATKTSEINTLNGKVTTLQKNVTSLQSQYDQAKATLNNYQAAAKKSPVSLPVVTQADLALTVDGSQYVNPAGSVTAGSKWFGVNITLTNTTSSAISVNDSDFHLKDLQSNEYMEETMFGASTLPTGWVSLPNKILAPGETLKGTVTFQMPNDTVKNFNFVNVTKVYSVTSAN